MISNDKLQSLVDRLERIEHEMSAAPEPDTFVRLSREHAEVAPVAAQARSLLKLRAELDETRAMLEDPATDKEMAALAESESEALAERAGQMEHGLQVLLPPRDHQSRLGLTRRHLRSPLLLQTREPGPSARPRGGRPNSNHERLRASDWPCWWGC